MKNIIKNIKSKVLHSSSESERDPLDELLDDMFPTGEDNVASGIIVLDEKEVVKVGDSIGISPDINNLLIFDSTINTYYILRELYPRKKLLEIKFLCCDDIILDMTSYKSVSRTYGQLKKLGYTASSDEELISFATQKMIPYKKLIVTQKGLGKRAFPNSKVRTHRLKVMYCHDVQLIVEVSYAYSFMQ